MARRMDWGVKACMMEAGSIDESCCGIAIFETTWPVSVAATFTRPSVPVENRRTPSGLNERLRQLPLWRCVRHAVSMVL